MNCMVRRVWCGKVCGGLAYGVVKCVVGKLVVCLDVRWKWSVEQIVEW